MNQDDPFAAFGDEDKTILRPNPGGRRRQSPIVPLQHAPSPPLPSGQDAGLSPRDSFDDNPLASCAAAMFSLVSRLRVMASPPDLGELQRELVAELTAFQNTVLTRGVSQQQSGIASYALCSLLDETILNTPWGGQSHWGHQSLLVMFHKEAWGGEKFFEFLRNLVQQPAQNLHLLEFLFLCLSFGFEGKYRIAAGGANTLEQMRAELFRLTQRVRGDYERDLSLRWQGLRNLRPAIIQYLPLWVVAAIAAAVLAMIYLGFLIGINSESDSVFTQIGKLSNTQLTLDQPAPAILPAATAGRFRQLLAAEIAQGLVEVADDHTLRIHNSFASASAQVKPEFVPMLRSIAKELEAGGDRAVISGHTDDKPIHSVRFPSNYDLSAARAKNVTAILLESAPLAGKVRSEGRADSEPLVPNDSPENRGINRRVDILIK